MTYIYIYMAKHQCPHRDYSGLVGPEPYRKHFNVFIEKQYRQL